MIRCRRQLTGLPAPYLKRLWLDPSRIDDAAAYPFCLPIFNGRDFEIGFSRSVTIIVGENGTGKSTILGGIAALAGYDEAGGGKGYMPVDHSSAIEAMGGTLAQALRASWLPKITTGGFFRAESFFCVSRYLDRAAREGGGTPPDFLSHSHGKGFLRFFEERCSRQGLYIFDEPESALSPTRQVEFLKILRRMQQSRMCQVIMATHSPMLMALPDAGLLQLTNTALRRVTLEETDHYRLWPESSRLRQGCRRIRAGRLSRLQCGRIDDDEHYYLDTEKDFGYIVELGDGGRIRAPERRFPA